MARFISKRLNAYGKSNHAYRSKFWKPEASSPVKHLGLEERVVSSFYDPFHLSYALPFLLLTSILEVAVMENPLKFECCAPEER